MMSMISANEVQLSQQLSSTLMPSGLRNCSIIEIPSVNNASGNATTSNSVQVTYEQYQQLSLMTAPNLNAGSGV